MPMLTSKDMKASIDRCHNQNLTLMRFKYNVLVQFEHGLGHLWFDDACIMEDPENKAFIWVMTEHYGYHVYARDEIRCCIEYKEVNQLRCGDDWDKEDAWDKEHDLKGELVDD